MIGSPLPIAILDRRLRMVDGVPTLVNLQMGNLSTACVRFDTSGPTFIATEAGKYLVMWCSSSKHETVEVSVSNPSSAAIARNEAKWQRGFFDQPMTGTWAYPTLWVNPVLTVTNQTRPFMPFGHVSHSVVVDLAQDEQFSLSVTGHTDREWTLVAWRMPVAVQENRFSWIMNSTTDTVSAGSVAGISTRYESSTTSARRILLSSTGSWSRSQHFFSTSSTGLNYKARVRLFRDVTDSTPDGGNLTFNLRLNGSTIATASLAIPTTGATSQFIEFVSDFSVIASGSSYELISEFVNPDSAEKRFEAELFLEQVFL